MINKRKTGDEIMEKDELEICPNCGRKLSGQEFLPDVSKMPFQVGLNFDPVAGTFICPDCNYSGHPVLVKESEYPNIKFSKELMDTTIKKGNPGFFRAVLGLFAAFFVFIVLVPFLPAPMAAFVALVFWIAVIYVMVLIPKFKGMPANLPANRQSVKDAQTLIIGFVIVALLILTYMVLIGIRP
jgi:predicted RNA-binding Zn-ribbon protein involved in translation (DUF1610 family)